MMQPAEIIGYIASILVFVTFYIKMMVPLRIVAICSNCAFIGYAYLDGLYPILFLHILLLPLNLMRLRQIIQMSWRARKAAHGDLNMDWIKPFSVSQQVRVGEILFKQGQPGTHVFVVDSGRFWLEELGTEVCPGDMAGELSLLAPQCRHAQTLECREPGRVLRMSLAQLEQLFFQNHRFGFYFLKLIASHAHKNRERLERTLAEREQEISGLRKEIAGISGRRQVAEFG